MFFATLAFANLLLASLLVGSVFGVWLSFDTTGMSAAAYVLHHQHAVRAVNGTLPVLGAVTIVLTTIAAALAHDDHRQRAWLGVAIAGFVVAGLVTRLGNQPLNAIVMTWTADAPPADWMRLRDAWRRWHLLRLAASLCGLCCLIAASLRHAAL